MDLGCAFMEVAPAVELFKQPRVPDGFAPERLEICNGAARIGPGRAQPGRVGTLHSASIASP